MGWIKSLIVVTMALGILSACGGSNEPLQADAGTDFSVNVGESPEFNGCGSTGDISNYQWTIITPPDTMPEDAGKVLREIDTHCSFTLDAAMGLNEVGEWIIELEVQDSANQTSNDTVTVTVNP